MDSNPPTPEPTPDPSGGGPADRAGSVSVIKHFPAGPTYTISDGDGGGPVVKVTQGVLRSLHHHGKKGLPLEEGGMLEGEAVEVKGYLLGHVEHADGRDVVLINQSVELPIGARDEGDLAHFSAADKARIQRALRRGGQTIGDYHSHPSHPIVLSDPDSEHMNKEYHHPYNVTAIVGPREEYGAVGFFMRDSTGPGTGFVAGQQPFAKIAFDVAGMPRIGSPASPAAARPAAATGPAWKRFLPYAMGGVGVVALALALLVLMQNGGGVEPPVDESDGSGPTQLTEQELPALVDRERDVDLEVKSGLLVITVPGQSEYTERTELSLVVRNEKGDELFEDSTEIEPDTAPAGQWMLSLESELGAPNEFRSLSIRWELEGVQLDTTENSGGERVLERREVVLSGTRRYEPTPDPDWEIDRIRRVGSQREFRADLPAGATSRVQVRVFDADDEMLYDDSFAAGENLRVRLSGQETHLRFTASYLGSEELYRAETVWEGAPIADRSKRSGTQDRTACDRAVAYQYGAGKEVLRDLEFARSFNLCETLADLKLLYVWDAASDGSTEVRYVPLVNNSRAVSPDGWGPYDQLDEEARALNLGRVAWRRYQSTVALVFVPYDQTQSGFEAIANWMRTRDELWRTDRKFQVLALSDRDPTGIEDAIGSFALDSFNWFGL